MAKARIDIIGDAASFLRAIRSSRGEAAEFRGDLSKLAVSARKTAEQQVKAASVAESRLRAQRNAYRELASAAKRGSREQVIAANLVQQAEHRLSRSIALTAAEQRKLSHSGSRFAAGRRGSAGSEHGGVRGLARRGVGIGAGVLFGAGSLVFGLKELVGIGIQADAAMGQLKAATKAVGDSSVRTNQQIEKQLETQRKLGFNDIESARSMTTLERATRSITATRRAQLLVDNIARGRHVAIATAANAVARAYGGQTGALRRLVPFIAKGATATQALQQASKAYAGAAAVYARSAAGAQAKLAAALESTAAVGAHVLLPTITRLSNSLANWLSKSRNQQRVQAALTTAVHVFGSAVRVLVGIIKALTPVVQTVTHALGGTKNTIRALAILFAAFKVQALVTGLIETVAIASGATTSLGVLAAMIRSLTLLAAAPILITVEILVLRKIAKNVKDLQESYLNPQAHVASDSVMGKLVPAYAKKYKELLSKGVKPGDAIKQLEAQLGGTSQADDIVANAINYAAGGPMKKRIDAMNAAAAKAAAKAGKAGGADTPTRTHGLTAAQKNQLALDSAKTPAAKLSALVEERRMIAKQIADVRKQLKTATGAQADLLITDLENLQSKDSEAYAKIAAINKAGAAKSKAAAAKVVAAAKAAARAYATSVSTHALELVNAAAKPTAAGATRAAYAKLIAYYKAEADDAKLTAAQRAHYAHLAIAAKTKMVKEIVADKRAADKAIETKQLKALGIDKGTSIGELLARVKTAAKDKEHGITDSGQAGTPSSRALRREAEQVSKALKGTYLDTNVSRNVLSRIKSLLGGKLGSLNAEMRGKIQQLLTGLKGDLNEFDGFNLTQAEHRRRSLDKRFADTYGSNRVKRGVQTPKEIHWHFDPSIVAIANEPIGKALEKSFFAMRAQIGRA